MINLMKKNVFLGVALPILLSAALCAMVLLPLSGNMGRKYLEYLKINSALANGKRISAISGGETGKAIVAWTDAGLAVNELDNYGKSLGIEFVSLTSGEPRKEAGFVAVPVELEIKAGYKKLGAFFGGLEGLEKSCISVLSFDSGLAQGDALKLAAKLSLKMYLLGDAEAMPASPPAQVARSALKSSYASWGRNPFVSPNDRGASLEDIHLEGIMTDKNGFVAVIDGEVVAKGEKAGENTVVDIKNDRVILNDGKKDFELRLSQ